MIILGLSCYYHDSAACLLKDGIIIAAAQEERFNRQKGSSAFPINAVNYCIHAANISFSDIDEVAFYEKPYLKFERVVLDYIRTYPTSFGRFIKSIPQWLQERLVLPIQLEEKIGFKKKIVYIPHHISHASSAFFVSKFSESAIITADAVGEWATTTIGFGKDTNISIIKEIKYPHSLGLFYSAITTYLGFKVNTGEGKVMAYASYGKPKYLKEFKKIISYKKNGSYCLNPEYFEFNSGSRMYTNNLIKLFGPSRNPDDYDNQKYFDIAATLQHVTEQIIVNIANYAYKQTGSKNLCLAGGIFLNCVANTKILKNTPFENLFIQPAAGDSGGALGATLASYYLQNNYNRSDYIMKNASLGPSFTNNEIQKFLLKNGIKFKKLSTEKLSIFIANKIFENKTVAILNGRLEFGPRALGNRSILANVMDKDTRNYLNTDVKHREWFRPYGIIILKDHLNEFFDLKHDSPFMLLVANVKNKFKKIIPSALQVDGTSRIQTITSEDNSFLFKLLSEYKKLSGIPMMINTSFNDNNEPIVCTPDDAYNTFKKSPINYLVLENYVIEQ